MGSTRTFTALLRSLLKKKKIGLTLVVTRRNSSPVFCAMVPQVKSFQNYFLRPILFLTIFQAETYDENGSQIDPPGFHLIPLPFADDIRTPPIDTALRGTLVSSFLTSFLTLLTYGPEGSGEVVDAAANIIGKMIGKKGYVPDAYPNPSKSSRLPLVYK
jgi:ATP-dependent DNA helicase 2 subunit 1